MATMSTTEQIWTHNPTSSTLREMFEFYTNLNAVSITRCKVQGDSKRWTQRACTSCRRYGLNSKRRRNTRQTVGCGIPSSLLALRVDLLWLCSKLSQIRLTFSSDTRGQPELLPLYRQPICWNWWFQRQMLFLAGGWILKWRRNARCTAVADSVLINSRNKKNCAA